MPLFPAFPIVLGFLFFPTQPIHASQRQKDGCSPCIETNRDCLNTGECGNCQDAYVEVKKECVRFHDNPVKDEGVATLLFTRVSEEEERVVDNYSPEFDRAGALPDSKSAAEVKRSVSSEVEASTASPSVTDVSAMASESDLEEIYLIIVIVCSCLIAGMGIIIAYLCWSKVRSQVRDAAESEYSYKQLDKNDEEVDKINGYTGAQRAQLYMYNQKLQQIKSMKPVTPILLSDYHSEEGSSGVSPGTLGSANLQPGEDDDTIYECSGPSQVDDTKIINPLFQPRRTQRSPSSSRSSPSSH
eukprot:m.4210 g.4210  ORF g.4210 m.4210 type:complete len:300 (+) comp10384_c0_seq2:118-1017(+)